MTRVVVAAATCLFGGCQETTSETDSSTLAEQACAPDSVGTLHLLPTVPVCTADALMCSAKCRVGDAGSCLAMAYAMQRKSKDYGKATRFYRRACLLGAANACTNCAAGTWAGQHSEEQLACARRTCEKACAAKEPFACGMVGRVMLESTDPPAYAEGRRYLEAACQELGGFACRGLAKHLESGKLGDYRPELVRTLLTRACARGDPDACGEPRTPSETFH
jgi:TPR repeat protein